MTKTTAELQAELEAIILWFESDEADIDRAEEQYSRALTIIKEIEKRITQTENIITKLKQSFDK